MADLSVSVILKAVDKITTPVRNITKATGNLTTGFSDAQKRLTNLNKKAGQVQCFAELKKKTVDTRKALKEATDKVGKLARQINQTEKPTKKLKQEFEKARRQAQLLKKAFQKDSQQLQRLRSDLTSAGIAAKYFGTEQRNLKSQIGDATRALQDQEARLQRLAKLQAPITETQNRIQANLDRRANLRGQMLDAAALGLTLAAPVKAAIDFESVMADVKKVVNFDTPQQFKQMGKDVLALSTKIPMTASGIGDIVAAAGQAGIARKELLRFAEDAAKMGVAFDMSGKDAGAAMTGLRSLFKLNQDQAVSLGDAYNHLANKMDARASDLLTIANKSGSVAALFGLTGQQLGALGATFKALKTPTDVAGTGINAILQRLATADKQPKKFQEALDSIGISAGDLKASIANDAQGALLDFLEAVKASDDVMGTLSELFGTEYADDVAKLVGGLDIYKSALDKVSSSTKYSGSMLMEYEERAKTTQNGIQLLGNRITRLGVSLGNILLPGVNAVVKVMGGFVDTISGLADRFPLLTKVIVGATAALVVGKIAAIGFGYAWTFVKGGLLSSKKAFLQARLYALMLSGSMDATSTQTVPQFIVRMRAASLAAFGFGKRGASSVVKGLKAASATILAFAGSPIRYSRAGLARLGGAMLTFARNPIKTLVTGLKALRLVLIANPIGAIVTAIAVAAALVYKYWEHIKAFIGGVVDGFSTAATPIKEAFKPLLPMFSAIGDTISWVAEKISSLFEPAVATSEELANAASAGYKFGTLLADGINLALTPLKILIKGLEIGGQLLSWVFGNDGEEQKNVTATKKIIQQVEQTGKVIPFPQRHSSTSGTDKTPAYTPLKVSGGNVNVQNHSNITVVQRQGEDSEALARRIIREEMKMQGRQADARQRAAMYDFG